MLSVRKIIKILKSQGFKELKQGATTHKKFRKGERTVTISYHSGGSTVPKKTFARIMQQAGLRYNNL